MRRYKKRRVRGGKVALKVGKKLKAVQKVLLQPRGKGFLAEDLLYNITDAIHAKRKKKKH